MKQTGLSTRELVYWGLFILIAISMTQLLLDLIALANSENNQFLSTTAYEQYERMGQRRDVAIIQTSHGDIHVRFMKRVAPVTINNFVAFAESDLYAGTKFHRIIKDMLVQGGDPLSRSDEVSLYGTGGPGFVYDDEIVGIPMEYGTVAMANRGKPDTNGSQFFIVTAKEGLPDLEGKHTIFGKVETGMDVVERIQSVETDKDDIPTDSIVINRVIVR